MDLKIDGELDLLGIGKAAEAIPPKVYTLATNTVCDAFKQLIAPITATTAGYGRYLDQKFDNMADVEKSLATFALQKAWHKAFLKAKKLGFQLQPPAHLKSFVKSLEEVSKETDPTLHELWVNLLASQFTPDQSHPHIVEILPHFSPKEAHVLRQLRPYEQLGEHGGYYLWINLDAKGFWLSHQEDTNLKEWNSSCTLLCQIGLSDVMSLKDAEKQWSKPFPSILYRTTWGSQFLKAVSE